MTRSLGYGKGYVYNPAEGYTRGCAEGYLPPQLQNRKFFSPDDCEPGHNLQFCQRDSVEEKG